MANTLAVLGSNKLVTTANAIMSEVFAGLIPDEVWVLTEEKTNRDYSPLEEAISAFSDNPVKIVEKVVGKGVDKWREFSKELEVDVADVTPGRKSMAIEVYAYSKAKEVRYVYLEEEAEGYRVFGYVPFHKLKVVEVRTGRELGFSPPRVKRCSGKEARLSEDGLRALINVYSLTGEVKISDGRSEFGLDELYNARLEDADWMRCAVRSGLLTFKEEGKVKGMIDENTFFVADTNVYISLGKRLREITTKRDVGYRLIPSRSVYQEIEAKTTTTQKGDEKLRLFQLASYAFKSLHPPPITSEWKKAGDIGLIEEVINLKRFMPRVVLITADERVARSAQSKGVEVVFLHDLKRGSLDGIGELIHCLSVLKGNVEIHVDGRPVATVKKQVTVEDKVVVSDSTGYACVLEKLEEFIRGG